MEMKDHWTYSQWFLDAPWHNEKKKPGKSGQNLNFRIKLPDFISYK